ncbi:stage V sporulation protein SpoVM, partial [Anaerotruncus colihominis]|uniref:stage V sporulation protein SpoVM n=1 Tax=Anaerotruncus colihominis TaxID=169435 RepID=UPI00210EC037
MKIVVIKSPKFLSPILRFFFKISKEPAAYRYAARPQGAQKTETPGTKIPGVFVVMPEILRAVSSL